MENFKLGTKTSPSTILSALLDSELACFLASCDRNYRHGVVLMLFDVSERKYKIAHGTEERHWTIPTSNSLHSIVDLRFLYILFVFVKMKKFGKCKFLFRVPFRYLCSVTIEKHKYTSSRSGHVFPKFNLLTLKARSSEV